MQTSSQPITASQLAAALAATTGALSAATPSGQSGSSSQQPEVSIPMMCSCLFYNIS